MTPSPAPPRPYELLTRKRQGGRLGPDEIRALIEGVVDGTWSDAQVAAFLMAAAIRGLDAEETRVMTRAMLESGEQWDLGAEIAGLGDKHSTGGVGDKVSLVLGPLLAACGQPVVMLTGRGLGHTGGTADKLEVIPGLDLRLERQRALRLLRATGLAVGVATTSVAPADRRLYALRDATATVDSVPLVVGSILSKKLAVGAKAVVFDVKTGSGAFFPRLRDGRRLARRLVATSVALGCPAAAWITDMSQPLGRWAGHAAEVEEALACLQGEGPDDLRAVTLALAEELARLAGTGLGRSDLEAALASGRAREVFIKWAEAQGGDSGWLERPRFDRAPCELVVKSPRSGVLAKVDCRGLGLCLAAAGAGRRRPEDVIDPGVSLEMRSRLGEAVRAGDELARLYLRRQAPELAAQAAACFEVAPQGAAPPLLVERIEG